MPQGLVVLVMGVSGCGKTTVGQMLAQRLSFDFVDADSFHSPQNVEKMQQGIPLTDIDRLPWLQLIASHISEWLDHGKHVVLACSALEEIHRQILVKDHDRVPIIFLQGSFDLISQRLAHRKGHFFDKSLLASQFAILQPPKQAITLDISGSLGQIVDEACLCIKHFLETGMSASDELDS